MRLHSHSRLETLAVVAVGSALALLLLCLSPASNVAAAVQRPLPGTMFLRKPHAVPGIPIRLIIPAIEVDAAIESVGLTAKGAMDVPKDPDNTGWYNLGARPGEKGNAVLAGHLDWYNGKKGVFQHLKMLKEDDVISIETDTGKFLSFIVRETHAYKPTDYAIDVFRKSDERHLNLVTCGGVWDAVRKTYGERLVVFADAVLPSEY